MIAENTVHQYDTTRWFRGLLVATAGMTYLLIVIGGIVRITGSGLGCPDWPTCYGQWIPPMRMDAILEYTHRLAASFTSPLILACAVVAWWRYRPVKLISAPLLAVVALLGIQGLLGGIVVLLETPPDLVALHMGNALLIQAAIILPAVVAHQMVTRPGIALKLAFQGSFARLTLWTLVVIFAVLVTGAIVVGTRSTFACLGWPLCSGQLIPSQLHAWIQMGHRALVAVAAVMVVAVTLKARRLKAVSSRTIRLTANLAAGLFFTQVIIGALKVNLIFPTVLMGMHVAVAAAVWAALIALAVMVGMHGKL